MINTNNKKCCEKCFQKAYTSPAGELVNMIDVCRNPGCDCHHPKEKKGEDSEYQKALKLADWVLEQPYCDPDGDLEMMSRQFLRTVEREQRLMTRSTAEPTSPPHDIGDQVEITHTFGSTENGTTHPKCPTSIDRIIKSFQEKFTTKIPEGITVTCLCGKHDTDSLFIGTTHDMEEWLRTTLTSLIVEAHRNSFQLGKQTTTQEIKDSLIKEVRRILLELKDGPEVPGSHYSYWYGYKVALEHALDGLTIINKI